MVNRRGFVGGALGLMGLGVSDAGEIVSSGKLRAEDTVKDILSGDKDSKNVTIRVYEGGEVVSRFRTFLCKSKSGGQVRWGASEWVVIELPDRDVRVEKITCQPDGIPIEPDVPLVGGPVVVTRGNTMTLELSKKGMVSIG